MGRTCTNETATRPPDIISVRNVPLATGSSTWWNLYHISKVLGRSHNAGSHMLISPLTALASALHTDPGVYAVLIGSGVSRAAAVPTGWEVTLELVQRVARLEADEPIEASAALAWWRQREESDPSYSELLEALAVGPAERQAILRSYFEPTERDRKAGRKVPTDAHHALAQLVREGIIRVVLTTNFDRLIEQALDAAGVSYDVWHSPDSMEGGRPLVHGNVVVVKLHGDYRDMRLLNTPGELNSYDDRTLEVLDRVLADFGLVVCGWSGEWDTALRGAMERRVGRFHTWWAVRGELQDAAAHLVRHRNATLIPIEDADQFFSALAQRVVALQDLREQTTDEPTVVVAELKRDLSEQGGRIRAEDRVIKAARLLGDNLSDDERWPRVDPRDEEAILERAQALGQVTKALAGMVATVAAHGDEEDATLWIPRVIAILLDRSLTQGEPLLWRYPALLCWYAGGVTAVARDRLTLISRVAATKLPDRHEQQLPVVAHLHPWRTIDDNRVALLIANGGPGGSKWYAPVGKHLESVAGPWLLELGVIDTARGFEDAIDRFDWLTGVKLAEASARTERGQGPWMPPPYVGNFGSRHRYRFTSDGRRWGELLDWITDDQVVQRVLPDASEEDRGEILQAHLDSVASVASSWI